MELNDKDLQDIERVAAAAYSPKEVAFILGFSVKAFTAAVKDEESEASVAYFKGLYSSELKVRESIMQMARNASSPAQTMANKLFDENRRTLTRSGISTTDED
jgi:hypothetical protein